MDQPQSMDAYPDGINPIFSGQLHRKYSTCNICFRLNKPPLRNSLDTNWRKIKKCTGKAKAFKNFQFNNGVITHNICLTRDYLRIK